MKVIIHGKQISAIYNADSMELVFKPLTETQDRAKLLAGLLETLKTETAKLPPEKRIPIVESAELAAKENEDPETRDSHLLKFLTLLEKNLGETAKIVITAVKLSRIIGGS